MFNSSASQAQLEPFRSLPSDTALRDMVSPPFSATHGKRTARIKAPFLSKSEKNRSGCVTKEQMRKSIRAGVDDIAFAVPPPTLPPLEFCDVKSNILTHARSVSVSLTALSDDM